jgi:thioredoxin reductase (NADPH)
MTHDADLDYDVVILGCGPAGLQAALHAARGKARVAVLGRLNKSSLYKAHIENYCCLDSVGSGEEMLDLGRRQAEQAGAKFHGQDVVEAAWPEGERFLLTLESGEILSTWTIIVATGISRNRLNAPGEKAFLGKGVSYCVDCDGNFFRGQAVAVVGNGSAAASGALQLMLIAGEVHYIFDAEAPDIDARLGYHVERSGVLKHPGRRVKAIHGNAGVESLELDNGETLPVSGVFIELGSKGALELAARLGVELDAETMKYVRVTRKQETNIPGVYAAGDVCGPPWQMAKAVGEGCVAGLEAAGYARKKNL